MSKIRYPVILVTQNLREGHVLLLADTGFTRDWRRATLAHDAAAAEALLAVARAEEARNIIVGSELIEVETRADGPWPVHYRERFRVFGFGHIDPAPGLAIAAE